MAAMFSDLRMQAMLGALEETGDDTFFFSFLLGRLDTVKYIFHPVSVSVSENR